MSWAETKKINDDMTESLDKKINRLNTVDLNGKALQTLSKSNIYTAGNVASITGSGKLYLALINMLIYEASPSTTSYLIDHQLKINSTTIKGRATRSSNQNNETTIILYSKNILQHYVGYSASAGSSGATYPILHNMFMIGDTPVAHTQSAHVSTATQFNIVNELMPSVGTYGNLTYNTTSNATQVSFIKYIPLPDTGLDFTSLSFDLASTSAMASGKSYLKSLQLYYTL